METSFTSQAVTRDIRVTVRSIYDPVRSNPDDGHWFFLYTVTVSNEGTMAVQLLRRHWRIVDENGKLEEVEGPGVVGETPTLQPGESFEYTSGCPLTTPVGTMHGHYRMVDADGEGFDVEIAPFTLSEPYVVN